MFSKGKPITRKNQNEHSSRIAETSQDNLKMVRFINQILETEMITFENISLLSSVKNTKIQNALMRQRVPKKENERIELFRFSPLIEKQMLEIETYKNWLSRRDEDLITTVTRMFQFENEIEQREQLSQNFPKSVHRVLMQTYKKQNRLCYFHETVKRLTLDPKYTLQQFQAARQALKDDGEVLDSLMKMSSKDRNLINSPDKVARVCKEAISNMCSSKAPFQLSWQQAQCLNEANEYTLKQNLTSVMNKINQQEDEHLDAVLQYMQKQTYHPDPNFFHSAEQIERSHIALLSKRRRLQIEKVWESFKNNIFFNQILQKIAFGHVNTHQIDEQLTLQRNLKLSLRTSEAINKIHTNTKDLYYLKLVLQSIQNRSADKYFDTIIKNISQMLHAEVRTAVLWIEHIKGINKELEKSINQFMTRHSVPQISTQPVNAITNLNQILNKIDINMKSDIGIPISSIRSNFVEEKRRDYSEIKNKQLQSSKIERKIELKVRSQVMSFCTVPAKKTCSICSKTNEYFREIPKRQLKIIRFPKEQQCNLSFTSESLRLVRSDYARISQIIKIYESMFIQHASVLNSQTIERKNIDEETLHALQIQRFIGESMVKKDSESKSQDKISQFTPMLTGNIFQSEQCIQKKLIIECLQKEMSKTVKFTRLAFRQDPKNKSSYHDYIDEKPNLIFLARTVNNRVVGAFTLGAFSKTQSNTSFSFLFAAFEEKINVFRLKKTPGVKAINYDDFYIIFGNSDVRLRPSEGVIFSNLGIANSSFDSQDRTVHDFIGMNKAKEVGVKNCEFHQVYFVDE